MAQHTLGCGRGRRFNGGNTTRWVFPSTHIHTTATILPFFSHHKLLHLCNPSPLSPHHSSLRSSTRKKSSALWEEWYFSKPSNGSSRQLREYVAALTRLSQKQWKRLYGHVHCVCYFEGIYLWWHELHIYLLSLCYFCLWINMLLDIFKVL